TQAPTEAPTEAQSETQVPSETEDQTGEKQTEKETERSERVNTGKKLKSSDITASLRAALPYLFAAGTVEGPEELLKDQEIAAGAEGSAVASGLADFSKKLANAVSSSDVEVINLYADKKGRLDTAQLDQRYSNHVIDVSKKYYVVNIIADHADQTLDFSGYAMVLSGERVTYDDEAQPGDILYNFAALDGKGYTGYKGTVTLANGAGLQGTFLAPEAGVNVNSNLAGAVYAKRVSVAGSVTELLQIAFVEGRQPEETAVTEGPSTEEATEAEIPKPQKAPSQKAPVTKAVMETEPETPPTKAETETETPPTKAETQQNETAGEAAGAKTLLETEEELLEAAGNLAETESVPYSDDKIVLNVKLVKAGQDKVPLTQGTVTVKAAITVLNKDNTVKYHAGDTVSSAAVSSSDSVKAGDGLTKGGRYYLELSGLPENYCNIQRICFSVGDDGIPVFEPSDSGVIMENGTLIITLYDQAQIDQVQESALLTVKKGDAQEADISNAVFVLKDSDKKIIRDTVSGNPSYYIHYAGTPILLTGLTVGKYYLSQISTEDGYQIAEEQPFEIKKDAGALVELSITNDPVSGENALKVFAQAYGNEQLLTAESDMKTKYYAALFKDKEAASRVSAVKEIIFDKDEQSSNELLFGGLEDGTYYLVPTNELGETLTDISSQITDTEGADLSAGISFAADSDSSEKTKGAVLRYKFLTNETVDTYPNGDFSYMATINLTNKLINYDGTELTGKDGDVFQIELYKDADRTQKVTSEPITFDMKGVSSASQTYSLKMTVGSAEYYLAESQTGQNLYTVSLPGNDGRIIVTCGSEPVNVEIQNKLNDTEVRLRLVDNDSGQYISDVFMVIKDKDGRIVSDNGKALVFKSGKKDYTVTNLLSGGQTYYLSQVAAPSGYAPTADVSFEVQRGTVSEVEMRAVRAVTTDYTVTVLKQVYSGKNQVYAQDDTSGTNAAKGRYTFYAALFADAAHTQKVSNVQKITVKGLGGSTVFQNLAPDTTYYVAETNVYGEPKVSTATQTIKYANGGKVSTTEKNRSTVIQNVYSGLPKGYRYTARLTLAKKVTKASGEAAAVTENFYAGIFRKADYSDKPTVIKLDLQNASSTYVSRRILLPDNAQTTYYIAEVNADGSRINTETFGYTPEISTPVLKISAGDDTSVTITNKEKSSKVTLYLTKKVYQGVTQKAVNETFYAGLFKDAKYTQLYTKPIPLNMNGKSELSLKLSLNLGSASNANIYVAEVDKDGKVIKDEEAFGYEIRVVNATAAFTQEKREIQTILLNSVYGSASQADWDQLLGSGSGFSGEGGGVISGNGEVGEAAQTGDDTPITLYLALMAAAVVLIVVIILLKKKRRS
ncbi:MAG: hypothetical protein Q4C61_15670, partial [Lachnospiraceae bacterium]|nr:hypothetical protein [Lachnospiraceae bacterium]